MHEAATLGREVVVLPTMRQDAPVGAVMAETQAAWRRLRAFDASPRVPWHTAS